MHVLHQGRAEYTLITPGSPPKIEKKVSSRSFVVDTHREARTLIVK